jgi:signal transduction histidine kinase
MPVNLADVVEQEIDNVDEIASSRGIGIAYHKPSAFPLLYLDEEKMRQMIMNYLDNAIYYSPESKVVTVRLYKSEGSVVFEVIDRGMGVPKGVQKRLFTKFFRAENAMKQRPDGTGIGLYLAKMVTTGHGGKVVFESTEGKGSKFGFRLPIKKLSTPSTEVE